MEHYVSDAAKVIGEQVARAVFAKRGNHTEAHLSEADLAAICGAAAAVAEETFRRSSIRVAVPEVGIPGEPGHRIPHYRHLPHADAFPELVWVEESGVLGTPTYRRGHFRRRPMRLRRSR